MILWLIAGQSFFKRKVEIVKKTRLDGPGSYQQKNAAAIEASYLVAQRTAKVKKPHTIAEELFFHVLKIL
jgi:stalled ribosome alternative rescue factor ArfA